MPTKHPDQKSVDATDMFLARINPIVWNPVEYSANAWRAVVRSQEVASMCKDTLISSILSLDWKIAPRDSTKQDELKATIDYYTKLLTNSGYGGSLDYTSHIELIAGDILDTPFGGASEIGKKDSGRVTWIEPMDAATLYPTYDYDYPVAQIYLNKTVYFPKENVARAYLSPAPQIERKGWGMPPAEKVFRSLQMLSLGDKYYANLLLDVPTAGILDLADMEKSSAEEWVNAFKSVMSAGTTDSFKIPVLYEHQNKVDFIPFGKVPNDIMFDRITIKYASLVCAAYGMTVGDIGLSTPSGETLAGSIRQERRTKKTGFARLKKKIKFYFDQILPETLQFLWIDYDDETNVAVGRSRLANATAFAQLITNKVFTPAELRVQAIQDGIITVSVPEKIDESELPTEPSKNAPAPERPGALGSTNIPASQGGEGEIVTGKSELIGTYTIPAGYIHSIANTLADIILNPEPSNDEFQTLITVPEELVALYDFDTAELITEYVMEKVGAIDKTNTTMDNLTVQIEGILSQIQISEE